MATDSCPSPCDKASVRQLALACGFDACGFAAATRVGEAAASAYRRWLDEGKNGPMDYMRNHLSLRDDPALLLPGARTVIALAMNYYPARKQSPDAPQFAYYAYGRDYHETVRERLRKVAAFITETAGASCRCCVDTAPLRERYWAQQAGIGFVGRNNQLIIPGKGSYFFLGEIITTAAFPPDKPMTGSCGDCRRCVDACPARALPGDYGAVDARRCLSCLTIELRDSLPAEAVEQMGQRVYGCDECQKACPHNRTAEPASVADFAPSEEFLRLDYDNLAAMTPDEFRRLFRHSAVRRAKHAGLARNVRAIAKRRK